MPFAERSSDPCTEHGGLTRRRFVQGAGALGGALIASQVVGTKVAFAADGAAGTNTVIAIFLRGGADGLRILSPQAASLGSTYLRSVRSALVPADADVVGLDGTGGWALHKAMAPLHSLLWSTGEMAFVPAVSHTGVSRSHFQAMQFLETGGTTSTTTGWLDRVLTQLGPGTTFRALAEGVAMPMSMAGSESKMAISSLAGFDFPAWDSWRQPSMTAVGALYAGVGGPLGQDVPTTLAAVATAEKIRAGGGPQNGAMYPAGPTGAALQDLAAILRAEVGLQVATVDVGGWDTHTDEVRGLDALLVNTAQALTAFFADLGAVRRSRVTVVVMSEFGRRVAMNASGGSDHGHGGPMWLLGGGLVGKAVHGRWTPLLSAADLDSGDVQGLNNPFNVLGEIVQKRLGVASLGTVFPGHAYAPLNLARTA
ncbi:MAG: DUF1501 domain-containing protein [Sporichthyaceae bacterium]